MMDEQTPTTIDGWLARMAALLEEAKQALGEDKLALLLGAAGWNPDQAAVVVSSMAEKRSAGSQRFRTGGGSPRPRM